MAYSTFNGWNIIPMPVSPAPRSITFSANDAVGQTQSPFTMQTQVQAWPGADWWEADVSLPPMKRQYADVWAAWLMAMRGKANVCMLADPSKFAPKYLRSGTPLSPLVNGAHLATATQLNTKGWPVAPALALTDPDFAAAAWTSNSALFYVVPGAGASGGGAYVYYGTGAASGDLSAYCNFTVTAGQSITASAYFDARNSLATGGGITVYNVTGGVFQLVALLSPVAGTSGRISVTATVPAGQTLWRMYVGTGLGAYRAGYPFFVSNPQVDIGPATSYFSPSVLQSGDLLQVGNRLHSVAGLTNVVPDASGNASIEVWPSIREALTDGQAITIYNPRGLFRLADNKRSWSVSEAKMYGISFKLVEAR